MTDVYHINIFKGANLTGSAAFDPRTSSIITGVPGQAVNLYEFKVTWKTQDKTFDQIEVVKNSFPWASFCYSGTVTAHGSVAGLLRKGDLIDVFVGNLDVGKPLIVPNPGVPSGPNASVNGLASATWDIKGYDCHGAVVAKWEKGMVGKDPVVNPLTQTVTFDNWVMAPLSKEDMVNILIKRDGVEWANIVLDVCDHGIARLFGWQPRKFFLEVQSKWILNPRAVIDKGCDCGAAASDYTISRLGGGGHSDWCKVANKP